MFFSRSLALVAGAAALLPCLSLAQTGPGTVKRLQKISHFQGGKMTPLDDEDQLGRSVAQLGDVDGDGVMDLAAAGHGDDDGGIDQGCAYVLFLRYDGLVKAVTKISEISGGFTGTLDEGDNFGRSLAGIGDLDGDGVPDLAVGANYDDDGGMNRGAIWVLCLNRDGTVKRTTKVSSTQGGFVGPLRNQDEFGRSVTSPGDIDKDGVPEIAVGSPTDSTGGTRRGAVWLLFMKPDGTVRNTVKIASGKSGFTGRLKSLDWFGFSVAPLGDFDRDGVLDLLVGAALDDDGAVNAGAVWMLFLKPDGTVKDHRKISMLSGNFDVVLESPDQFGTSVCTLGDVNHDGVTDIAVGAVKDSDGGKENGSVYVLFLKADGTVSSYQKISDTEGDFTPKLDDWDWFGSSLAALGDLDRDGVPDFAVGTRNDDDGGPNRGAVFLTFLRGPQSNAMADVGASSDDAPAAEPVEAEDARDSSYGNHGRWAEPEGSLELVGGEAAPGSTLVFRLGVPEAFVARGARARLLVSRGRSDTLFAERTGLLVDPHRIVHARNAEARSGRTQLELRFAVPEEAALLGGTLVFQALWQSAGAREHSDALELRFD